MSTWLLSGASGLLGHDLCRHLRDNGKRVIGLCHNHPIDLDGVESVDIDLYHAPQELEAVIDQFAPDVAVHAAGLTSVDGCETHEDLAMTLHAEVTSVMARAALQCSAKMIYISTDHLWDGSQPLVSEEQEPQPINAYARTKLEGERRVLGFDPNSLVVRTNFYGPGRPWRQSFSDWIINSLSSGQEIMAFTDAYFTPICLQYLCSFLERMVENQACGIYNIAGSERVSKYDFAVRLADALGLDKRLIKAGRLEDAHLTAQRPLDMSLSVEKVEHFLGQDMPTLSQCFKTLEIT